LKIRNPSIKQDI